jgi:hypothetical protein
LATSVPTWWERWHLPLIPPLCLLAGMGLTWLGEHCGDVTPWRPHLPGARTGGAPGNPGLRAPLSHRERGCSPPAWRVSFPLSPRERGPGGEVSQERGLGGEVSSKGQGMRFVLPAAQYVSALAMEPSFLGRGFGALVLTPFGAGVHLAALGVTLGAVVYRAVDEQARGQRPSPAAAAHPPDGRPPDGLPPLPQGERGTISHRPGGALRPSPSAEPSR